MADSLKVQIARIDERVKEIKDNMVTGDEFRPVKSIVYGMVGLILVAVVGALVTLVVR